MLSAVMQGAGLLSRGVTGSDNWYLSPHILSSWHAALRTKWSFPVSLDPSRAHNQLCLMNDFTGVPGSGGAPNVDWLEVEDR